MDFLIINEGFPILSTLVFLPLVGALVLLFLPGENAQRMWSMIVTVATAVISIPLYTGFDATTAKYQFAEHISWIPSLNINYTLGIDGISLLLVLLTQVDAAGGEHRDSGNDKQVATSGGRDHVAAHSHGFGGSVKENAHLYRKFRCDCSFFRRSRTRGTCGTINRSSL